MSSRLHRMQRHRARPDINLTPMLDIILNLIFFFILTTTIRDEVAQIDVRVPGSTTAQPSAQTENLPILSIDAAGDYYFNGRAVVEPELQLHLNAAASAGTRRLRLRADERTPHGRVIEAMDLCREAGIESVYEDTRPVTRN